MKYLLPSLPVPLAPSQRNYSSSLFQSSGRPVNSAHVCWFGSSKKILFLRRGQSVLAVFSPKFDDPNQRTCSKKVSPSQLHCQNASVCSAFKLPSCKETTFPTSIFHQDQPLFASSSATNSQHQMPGKTLSSHDSIPIPKVLFPAYFYLPA